MKWKTDIAKAAITADRIVTEVILIITVIVLLLLISSVTDYLEFSRRGLEGVKYCDFSELIRINPDTCAWLRISGTNINHPVVQGKDDYKYLETDFHGKYYAGGTLFLSCRNNKNFSDSYNLIHGHHMAMGAMFGDLTKFNDRDFYDKHGQGVLLTPKKNYRLKAAAVCRVDSHDERLYDVSLDMKEHSEGIRENSVQISRTDFDESKLLVLSTCTGNMDDYRTVVVFVMKHDPALKTLEEDLHE